jgi:predicted transcriptional regulator of viral defense system
MRVEVAGESAVEPVMGAQPHGRVVDGLIAALAHRQHGVVGRAQLVRLGLGRRAIGHRLGCGRLHRVHRGVYAVGHRVLSQEATWMAAALAGGPNAVLSHRSAAALWGIRTGGPTRVEVTVPRALRSRTGLHVHRGVLAADEVTAVRGIPVTTAARTLLDLAAVLTPARLERAVEEAERLRLGDDPSLHALVARHPRRRGVATLRRILDDAQIAVAFTRSELEERFLAFLADAGLPRPLVNAPVELLGGTRVEADCLWPAERLAVELDGHASHATRAAFERDRARDRGLQAAGWRVVRITWRHLHGEPQSLAAELRMLLRGERDRR